jgi:hypothetical protein
MEEKHMAEQKPPPAGEPGQTPPLQPGEGGGGFMGLGEPYVDFIPTSPMVKDPATGEWRNAQPGELPKPEQQPPNEDQNFKPTGGPDNQIPPGYEDEVAAIEAAGGVPTFTEPVKQPEDQPGGRLDPNAPADPGLPKFARDDLGQPPPGDSSEPPPPAPDPETVQALDPNLLDPNLLDPIAPGPTLDYGLVERIEQSPGLVEAVNQDPAVAEALEQDPTQLDQIEQNLGLAEQRPVEPSAVTDLGGVTDPSLVPDVPDPGPPDQDFDDIPN